MTNDEFNGLQTGDVLSPKGDRLALYVVNRGLGRQIVATRLIHIADEEAQDWDLRFKAKMRVNQGAPPGGEIK